MAKRELKKLDSPEVEVMAKERPYALQMIQMQILYDIASLLEELTERTTRFHSSWEETIPVGEFKSLTYPITDRVTELSPKTIESMPWRAFTIFNDGPSPIYLVINEDFPQTRTPVNMGENLTVNMTKRKIEKIYLNCAAGLTSTVRIFVLK
jgi:hypothetical protein